MKTSREKYARNARAFTLLELLIVVSVIAILVMMLISTIGMVRSLAKRTKCASNLRQIGVAFREYAGDNEGKAILVYTSGVKQGTYVVNNTNNTDGPWSVLWKQGFIAAPQLMYCPSTVPASTRFNTSTNVWPHQAGAFTRAGYCNRPEVDAGTNAPPQVSLLPHWVLYSQKAIASDLCSDKAMVYYYGHRNGVNTAYGDGGVKWVPLSAMQAVWTLPSAWSNVNNALVVLLWQQYDSNR